MPRQSVIVIELKTEPVKTSPVCWSTHRQQESQIALRGDCFQKIKQRWRTLLITVNTTKTEISYLIRALVLLKTCFYNKHWNIFSVNVFCFTKLSVFWNQRYNSLKSDFIYPLGFLEACRPCVWSFKSNMMLVFVISTLDSVGKNFLFSYFCCTAMSLKFWNQIFHSFIICKVS